MNAPFLDVISLPWETEPVPETTEGTPPITESPIETVTATATEVPHVNGPTHYDSKDILALSLAGLVGLITVTALVVLTMVIVRFKKKR